MPTINNGLELSERVASSRISRVVDADDNSKHIMYINEIGLVQTISFDVLGLIDPTDIQIQDAITVIENQIRSKLDKTNNARQRVINNVKSVVGLRIDDLNTPQLKSVLALILWKEGAIDENGVIKPLNEWLRGET